MDLYVLIITSYFGESLVVEYGVSFSLNKMKVSLGWL